VDDRGAYAAQPRLLERRPSEHREAPRVVRIITRRVAVQAVAIEQVRRVDEHERDAFGRRALVQRHACLPASEVQHDVPRRGTRGVDPAISGQDERDLVALSAERVR
jgi:hypothetical protein